MYLALGPPAIVSAGAGNSFDFASGTYATFIGCGTPNNAATFNTNGTVTDITE